MSKIVLFSAQIFSFLLCFITFFFPCSSLYASSSLGHDFNQALTHHFPAIFPISSHFLALDHLLGINSSSLASHLSDPTLFCLIQALPRPLVFQQAFPMTCLPKTISHLFVFSLVRFHRSDTNLIGNQQIIPPKQPKAAK